MKTAISRLLKSIILGLTIGGVLGVVLGLILYFDAVRKVPELQQMQRIDGAQVQSYLCAAGQAPTALGIWVSWLARS